MGGVKWTPKVAPVLGSVNRCLLVEISTKNKKHKIKTKKTKKQTCQSGDPSMRARNAGSSTDAKTMLCLISGTRAVHSFCAILQAQKPPWTKTCLFLININNF